MECTYWKDGWACRCCRGHKRALNHLDLELQVVMSCPLGAGNCTQALCEIAHTLHRWAMAPLLVAICSLKLGIDQDVGLAGQISLADQLSQGILLSLPPRLWDYKCVPLAHLMQVLSNAIQVFMPMW
jgi:hypothetical protein